MREFLTAKAVKFELATTTATGLALSVIDFWYFIAYILGVITGSAFVYLRYVR